MKSLINFRQQYHTLENDGEEDENNFEAGVESINNMGQVLVSSFYISYYNTTVLLYKSLDSDNKFFNAIKYPNEKDPPKNGLPLTFGINVDFEITNWITKDPKDRNLPYVVFKPITAMKKKEDLMKIKMPEVIHLSRFQLFFKFVNTNGSRLIRCALLDNGLVEVAADSEDYDLLWTGKHVKRSMLQQMTKYQKINHFPRTFEITRKDRMYLNVVKFKEMFPKDGFDFLPKTYVLPEQYSRLRKRLSKESDDKWILKPNSSSRGRGIFIIKDINDVSFESTERCVVSRYIPNPLLIDGLKFDLRIYIVMTSVYPLKLWMFNEGLTRFATEKYTQNAYKNPFIHLTNYSINKKSKKFVKNENNEEENVGNKWSFSAFLKFLHNSNVDTTKLVGDITDVITKAFISIEPIVFKYTKAFVQHRTNCYELFGVDVLIDDNLKPIIMEVNLSPSLSCDAPIDLRIKSKLVSDIFNIVGVSPYDRILEQKIEENVRIRTEETEDENFNEKEWKEKHRKMRSSETLPSEKPVFSPPLNQATMNEVILETQQELTRRGDFDLIFPNANNKYDKFFHPSKVPLYRYMREKMDYPKQSLAENVLKSKINVNNNAKLNIK